MWQIRLLGAGLCGLLSIAHAETGNLDAPPKAPSRVLKELYGGVVINQTVSVGGQEFYQQFMALWRDKEMSERYTILIQERPSARWGSQVWIEFAQKRVFQAALPTARFRIGELSAQAVETAYKNVMDTDFQRLFFRDADIGPDEM